MQWVRVVLKERKEKGAYYQEIIYEDMCRYNSLILPTYK